MYIFRAPLPIFPSSDMLLNSDSKRVVNPVDHQRKHLSIPSGRPLLRVLWKGARNLLREERTELLQDEAVPSITVGLLALAEAGLCG